MKRKCLWETNYHLLQKELCQKYSQSLGELGYQLDAWYVFWTHFHLLGYKLLFYMWSYADEFVSLLPESLKYVLWHMQKILDTLHQALPSMSLIASDFSYLPDVSIPGDRAPLVSSKVTRPSLTFGAFFQQGNFSRTPRWCCVLLAEGREDFGSSQLSWGSGLNNVSVLLYLNIRFVANMS